MVQADPAKLKQVLINVLYNAIKFTEQGGIHIDLHIEMPQNAAGADPETASAAIARGTWALLRDRSDDERVWLYNLHLDHESQPSREKSVAFLLAEHERRSASQRARDATAAEFGGAQPEPRLMIMGDFNSNEQNPAYRAALTAGLRSAYRVIDPATGDRSTFTGFKDTPDWLTGVIDHILIDSRWKVIDAGIDMRKFGPLWPSDHFPVWSIVKAQ